MPLLRKTPGGRFALPVAMAAVRLGERVLIVGASHARMLAAVAAGAGMTGQVAAAVPNADEARVLSEAAAKAGVLLEVDVVSAWEDRQPLDPPFDVAVVDLPGGVGGPGGDALGPQLRWVFRSLRRGGRAIVVERHPSPLSTWLGGRRSGDARRDRVFAGLDAAGFQPVRVLADRGGWRFVEGLRGD